MPRRPDMPCAGCGKLIWRSRTSLPAGQATCNACRSAKHGTHRRYKGGCRCDECRAENARVSREFAAQHRTKTGHSYRSRYLSGYVWIPVQVRLAIYERDRWVCQLCNDPVDPSLHPNHRMAATLDHVECQSWVLVPDHSTSNLRLAHRSCNSQRNDERWSA